MLLACIIGYLVLNVLIGVYASRYVKSSSDFMLAGSHLPLGMATFTVFATWFGSETILGASSYMAEGGLLNVIEDPFGAALCLILVGLFFARPLYRLRLLTFGDFYRTRFGKQAERVAGIALVLSYFGWIAAQMVAIGIIFSTITGVGKDVAILGASLAVIAYTFIGGMWAVSITDTIQSVVIIVGIIVAAIEILPQAGGLEQVFAHYPDNFFRFVPDGGPSEWLEYMTAWFTIGLGSIPQQDIYQRVMASKSEKVAVRSTFLAGFMYLTIGLVPLLLGLVANMLLKEPLADGQLLVPSVILQYASLPVQILFFGALLSAIMSTSSGAILAPAVILSENLIKPLRQGMSEQALLRISRMSVAAVGLVSLGIAFYSRDIYTLVGEASVISMVSLFVPLVAGLFFKITNEAAALLSILCGMAAWVVFSFFIEPPLPVLITGTLASLAGLLVGLVVFKNH